MTILIAVCFYLYLVGAFVVGAGAMIHARSGVLDALDDDARRRVHARVAGLVVTWPITVPYVLATIRWE